VVFTSNVFALLGLRALYFLLAGAVGRLRYLRPGLSVILAAAAGKLLLSDIYAIPVWVSPAFILSVLAVVAVMSRWDPLTRAAAAPHPASALTPHPAAGRAPHRAAGRASHPASGARPPRGPEREGSGPVRERDDAADGVNTVYSRQ
jgi:hypothetical protein